MTQVKTVQQLKQMISEGVHDFFIQLNYGARSAKFVDYSTRDKRFYIENEIDGSKQRLNETNLFNERHTNIGKAINAGAFYSYE